MPKKRFSPEQIVTLLRQIEVTMGQGTHAVDTDAASGGEDRWVIARKNLKRYSAGDKLYALVNPKQAY
jgi:hypothetical protein